MATTSRGTIPEEYLDHECIHCHRYAFRHDDNTQRAARSIKMQDRGVDNSTPQNRPSQIFHQTTWNSNTNSHESSVHQETDCIKIVCIADTHNGHRDPGFNQKLRQICGDILIHAGDFSNRGTISEITDVFDWLSKLDNFKYKVVIAGNMDGIGLDKGDRHNADYMRQYFRGFPENIIYLENNMKNVLGINIYGCPYTPQFYGGFQYIPKSLQATRLWNQIPEDCDILVSHGPPSDVLDKTSKGQHVGCNVLRQAIQQRPRLKAVVFGHIHHSFGCQLIENKWFINAAQYNGIFHRDRENQPFEIMMRRDDKKIAN
ncbi:unnamed protein product, partial [Rotaria socialis]